MKIVIFVMSMVMGIVSFASETSNLAAEIIMIHEGFSPTWYKDPAGGGKAIGYGETVYNQPTITKAQAKTLLQKRTASLEKQIDEVIRVPLTTGEKAAVISFVYNVGFPKFKASTMLKKINEGKKDEVPAQFHRWVRGDGKIMKGLVARRAAEVAVWNS